jgi:hypothetical protein
VTPDTASFRESYLQLLSEVLKLQKIVVSGAGAGDDAEIYYSAVERYCEEVDRLINLITDPFFTNVIADEGHVSLTEVLVNHQSITTKLETELYDVGQQRKALQKKIRGISHYIDKLPKRVSTVRAKKG